MIFGRYCCSVSFNISFAISHFFGIGILKYWYPIGIHFEISFYIDRQIDRQMDGWIGKKTKQELYCPFFSLSPCLPILGSSNNDDDDDVIQRLFPHTHTTYIETYIFHSRFPYISIGNTFNRIECERQKKKICFPSLLCLCHI